MDSQADAATVLLVEDTEDNRQMMRRLLELSGYRVVEATNGKEAVEAASRVRPQIILMDLESAPGGRSRRHSPNPRLARP